MPPIEGKKSDWVNEKIIPQCRNAKKLINSVAAGIIKLLMVDLIICDNSRTNWKAIDRNVRELAT